MATSNVLTRAGKTCPPLLEFSLGLPEEKKTNAPLFLLVNFLDIEFLIGRDHVQEVCATPVF